MQKATQDILDDIKMISKELAIVMTAKKMTYRALAQSTGLALNSVKSIIDGKPANIQNYAMVAKALGTSLGAILKGAVNTASAPNTTVEETTKTPAANATTMIAKPSKTSEKDAKVSTEPFRF